MASPSVQQETEIKLPVDDLGVIRARLRALGATPAEAKSLERNTLFDHADNRLRRSDQALRLRRCGDRTILTFKGPSRWSQGVRTREEIEIELADGDSLEAILRRVGLEPSFHYEKWRETWQLETVAVALDDTPMGSFVELEGPANRIPDLVRALGLDPADAAHGSYPSLWTAHREGRPDLDLPVDMVFTEQ